MIDNLTDKQKKIAAIIGVIVVIGVIYFIYKGENKKETQEYENMLIQSTGDNNIKDEKELGETIVIHIAGAVKIPGVVKLKEGSRIEDAINLAGGLAEDADITNVNLAYVLDDGTKINIPRTTVEADSTGEQNIIEDGSGENVIEQPENTTSNIRTSKYK